MEDTQLSTPFLFGHLVSGTALAGILVASLLNLRTARGPREFRYILRWTPVLWLLLILLVVVMWTTPAPGRYVVLVAYLFLLPAFMYHLSYRRQLIRHVESSSAGQDAEAESPQSSR